MYYREDTIYMNVSDIIVCNCITKLIIICVIGIATLSYLFYYQSDFGKALTGILRLVLPAVNKTALRN